MFTSSSESETPGTQAPPLQTGYEATESSFFSCLYFQREGALCSRKRSRDLLNTSHSMEYNLRSRTIKKLRKL